MCVCHSLRPKAFFKKQGTERSLSNEATTPVLGKRTCEFLGKSYLRALASATWNNEQPVNLLLTRSFSQCVFPGCVVLGPTARGDCLDVIQKSLDPPRVPRGA